MQFKWIWIFVLLAVLGGLPSSEASDVVFSLKDIGKRTYILEGNFHVDAPPRVAWSVLSDYENIGKFVPRIRHSKIVGKKNGTFLLEQEAVYHIFFLERSVRVTLEVHEEPIQKITFEDISHREFDVYMGFWNIESVSNGSRVLYQLKARSLFLRPAFLEKGFFEDTVRDLMRDVQSEIERRATNIAK